MSNISFNGFNEHMPYTDFQTLNLDWVYSKINGILEILSKTNPDIKNNILFAKNREELSSTHYTPGTYVFAMGKDAPGDAGAALYKIVPADGSNTPAAFPVASGKAVLQIADSVNTMQLDDAGYTPKTLLQFAVDNYTVINIGSKMIIDGIVTVSKPVTVQTGIWMYHENAIELTNVTFVVSDRAVFRNLYMHGTNNNNYAFDIRNGCVIDSCYIDGYKGGVNADANSQVVKLVMRNNVIGTCADFGVRIDGKANNKTCLLFDNNYIVKIGDAVMEKEAPATTDRGHGLVIYNMDSGHITNNVFEFCSGAGIYMVSQGGLIDGVLTDANYFEACKLCGIYTGSNATNSALVRNNHFASNYFYDTFGAVANSMRCRQYSIHDVDNWIYWQNTADILYGENPLNNLTLNAPYFETLDKFGTIIDKDGVVTSSASMTSQTPVIIPAGIKYAASVNVFVPTGMTLDIVCQHNGTVSTESVTGDDSYHLVLAKNITQANNNAGVSFRFNVISGAGKFKFRSVSANPIYY